MKTFTLSGWGQPHTALADIAPENAGHFDYSGYNDIKAVIEEIAEYAQNYEAVIGWSLGGQLAVRAIAAGLMQPKKLILICVPFQFVRSEKIKIGMPQDKFQKFRDNYDKNAERTLSKAWELIVLNDKNPENIRSYLAQYDKEEMLEKNWLNWLDILNNFSCDEVDFSCFPKSLLIYGKQDAVVEYNQMYEFSKAMPQARHTLLEDAGHAPHWHDKVAIKKHIEEYLYV